ncbi:MAG: ABC transporter ATP-binding protein [Vicinamibacterales bacterium]
MSGWMTSEATGRAAHAAPGLATWLALVGYLGPHRRRLTAGFALLLVATAMDLLKPWPLKWIFDGVLLGRPVGLPDGNVLAGYGANAVLGIACGAILLTAVVGGLCEYFSQVWFAGAGQGAVASVKRDLFAHMQRLSLDFHRKSKGGELLTRLVKDVTEIKNALTETALESVTESVLLICMMVLLFNIDAPLAAVSALTFPALALCVWYYSGGIRSATRRQRDKESRTASIFSESLAAISVIQAFSRESQTTRRFDRESRKSAKADLAATRLRAGMNRWVELIVAAGTCGVLFYGVRRVAVGAITPGDLIVFSAYLRGMYKPVRRIASNLIQISRATVGAGHVVEILQTEPDVRDLPGAVPAPSFAGRIEFEDVSFGYDGAPPILSQVSFAVEPGMRVAMIGRSGAGKSTLASLIPRMSDPTTGRVRIDGRDIREFTLESLRQQVSTVAQESVLFGMSIEDNIAFGTPDATMDRIVAAAKTAGAHDFVMRLPKGYATVVGERGATLSGGERQRVALARAFCRDARILILDEPTTGLDVHAESHLLTSLNRLMEGRTTFIIAHRLATIARADVILHVDDGTVCRMGTHEELLASDASYRELARLERAGGLRA